MRIQFVLWMPRGERPNRSPLNPAQSVADREADSCSVAKEILSSFGTQMLIFVTKRTRHSAQTWAY